MATGQEPSANQKTCKAEPQATKVIQPLEWIQGKWRGTGEGRYPTIKDFKYEEEAEFFTFGQPNIQFSLYSWCPETKKPLHREVGFIRIKPGTNNIAFLTAHNNGVTEVREGEVTDNALRVVTNGIHRMTFSKEPETKKLVQTFHRKGDELEHVILMETSRTRLTEHLRITYKKVD